MRKTIISAVAVGLLLSSLTACGDSSSSSSGGAKKDDGKITLGFAQVGAESGWRAANTKSIMDSAKAAGIDLDFQDGQQKQEVAIAAIRTFIQKKVDVIAFSPKVETGWDGVLKEAKDAGIPVILTDRGVTADPSLYQTFLGSDFVVEGQRAGDWLTKEYAGKPGPVNIVELEGTTGSAPAIDRKKGFGDVIAKDPKFKVIASQTAEFTRAKGKEVMTSFLQQNPKIDVLYAQNDDMGLGAIQAIEEAGKKPGVDIKIITVDGTKDAFTAMAAKKINVIVECNPLLGPQLMDLAKKVVNKETVEKRILTKEDVFTQDQAAAALPTRQY